jgi:hypothetical protein
VRSELQQSLENIWEWASDWDRYEKAIENFLKLTKIKNISSLRAKIESISLNIFGDLEDVPNKQKYGESISSTVELLRDQFD